MHKRMKRVLVTVLLVVLVMSFAGCSRSASVVRQPLEDNTAYVSVSGTCTASVESGNVVVSAETDIIDSAIVTLSVTDISGKILSEMKLIKNGDSITASFPIGTDWGDEVYGYLVMTPESNGKQPDGVLSVYGNKFGNIESDYLIYDGKVNMIVIQSEKLTIE